MHQSDVNGTIFQNGKFNTLYTEGVIQRKKIFLQNSLAGVSSEHRSHQYPYPPGSTLRQVKDENYKDTKGE